MPISHEEWQSIDRRIADLARPSEFVQGKVIKVDKKRNVIFLKEFGDQPIPLYAFEYTVKYYDIDNFGRMQVRKTTAKVILPKKGDMVLVAKQFGSRRLPKCLGVLRSINFALEEGD
jgi:hypothetical protein